MDRYRQMRNRVKQKEENVQNTKFYSEKKKTANDLKENDELLKEGASGTIVFVKTKRSVDFLASLLSETDYPTIHGDRFQCQRKTALADFKAGRMKALIATSVATPGLDAKII
ncbi:hypothetical protein GQX74_014192 [Glossina fuscipes]|nr:hypothetical protein GQX74_014192 [Glossina fuscipes]